MRLPTTVAAGLAAVFVLGSCSTMNFLTASRADPYLWLEQVESDQALAWVREQNAQSLPRLESDPRYAELNANASAIATNRDRLATGTVRDGHLYNFWQDDTHVRGIWRRASLDSYAAGAPQWETLLDIDALARTENANWVYQGSECRADAARCMISLSDGGKDASTWREFDIAARGFVQGGFVIPENKSSVAWIDNDTLLVGTDWGPGATTESGYAMVVKAWRRGTPLASATELMRGQVTDVGVFVAELEDVDGTHIPIAAEADTFFETTFWRLDGASAQRINLPPRATIQGLHKGFLVFTLEQAWQGMPQGALAAFPLGDTGAATPRATVLFAPNPRQSIEQVSFTRDAILVSSMDNVRGRVLRVAYDGRAWVESQIELPANGAVNFAGASPSEERAFGVFEDFLTPETLYAFEERATRARAVQALPAQFDASGLVAEQFETTSRDGTRVPYFVIRPRNQVANSQNPTVLYAYGGFQVSQTPNYNAYVGKLWLERGGTFVVAAIRGGGEFGPAWHQAGLTTNRQVIYDDFFAVEQDLVARNITSPRRLGMVGRSNGGLLMGVMLNQHPEMVNAAVVGSPLLDMLRYDQLPAGASWVGEYGSPHVRAERRFLETISPYQNLEVRPGFPLPFIYTSTKDDRVHPGHARKYVARLAELGLPYLYYENVDGGHSAAANLNEAARRYALEYTYFSQRLMD